MSVVWVWGVQGRKFVGIAEACFFGFGGFVALLDYGDSCAVCSGGAA